MYTRLYVLVQKNKDLLGENKIIGIFELFEGERKVKELNSLYSENIYKLKGPYDVRINKKITIPSIPDINFPNINPFPGCPHPDIFPESPK